MPDNPTLILNRLSSSNLVHALHKKDGNAGIQILRQKN